MTKKLPILVASLMLAASTGFAQLGTTSPTATVAVNVNPEAALTIQTPALTLSQIGNNFTDYSGTTAFTYFIRTMKSGGTGNIVLQVTTDFSAGGGNAPSVNAPPTVGDHLYYSCTVPSPTSGTSTPCTGPVNSLTTASTNVATFGANARSAKTGVSSSVIWGLTNDPLYQTGTYTATITYTISAA